MNALSLEPIEFKDDYAEFRSMLNDIDKDEKKTEAVGEIKEIALHAKTNPLESFKAICDILTLIEGLRNGTRRNEAVA